MIVGEAPGKDEVTEGRPFVGNAGKLLRKSLAQVGIDPEAVYMTNLSKYRPPANDLLRWFGPDGKPSDSALMLGLVELEAEIQRVKPNVIVACGNFPLWALTGLARWRKVKRKHQGSIQTYTGIHDWRGSIVECKLVDGFKVVPTFHPSYILREGYADHGIFLADLERIKRESEFPEIRYPKKELIADPRGPEWLEVRSRFLDQPDKTITCDIEYVGKNLICVGLTNDRDWATTIHTKTMADYARAQEILISGAPLNMQNAMFECSILEWNYKTPVIKYLGYDTMLAAHASNIELPKGLDFLTSIYTDQRYYKDMVDWDLVKKGKQPFEEVLQYNMIDVWVQHEVMEEQLKYDLNDPAIMRTFRFEMQLLRPLWDVAKRGVRIDTEGLQKYREELERDIRVMGQALNLWAGREINVKSGKDIGWILFDRLGLNPVKMNKTGPATDDKTIAAVKLQATDDASRQVIELIRSIRNRRDLISKFVDVQFDDDGRMRGHYDPAGTKTGRLASRKFYPTDTGGNQQNIPRADRVRSLFVPDPGKLFCYADLERAESLVVAHLTQDHEMLRVHGRGVDAHKELAAILFNKAVEEVTKDERYLGKQTRHAGNYMQGPRTFMTNVNKVANKTGVEITFTEARKYIDIYRAIHPFLKRWWKDVEGQLWKDRTLYNLLGRRRIFYGHIGGIVPEAVAFVPQSTVGDTLNVGLLNLEGIACDYMKELDLAEQYMEWSEELREYGYRTLMQVHDAVGFEVNEKDAEKALPLVERLMSIPLTAPKTLETFTIPVEILVGPNWGEQERWEPKSIAV